MVEDRSVTDAAPPSRRSSLPRVGLLVMGRKRPGFDADWAAAMETAASTALENMDLSAARATVRVVDDASLRRALGELREYRCDTLVVLQPTMGDGRLAPVLAQLWGDPMVLWATPERPDGGKVSSCSLVGAHAFASIFRQLGREFELAYGHPDDDRTRAALTAAATLTAAAAKLRRSKVGLIGYHAPGFINMHVDPALMSRLLGVELHHFGLQEFFDLVEGQPQRMVEDDMARVAAMDLPFGDGTGPDDLAVNSRYYLALHAMLWDESLDALALRCWPEVPNRLGAWPYLAMSRLAEENKAIALEGDVDGAVSCLFGRLLNIGSGYISDWLAHDEHSITLWHPGHAPPGMCAAGSAWLGRHFNTNHPLVLNATLAEDRPITLFRLWHCDGRYRMTACDARTARGERELAGAHGVAVVEDRRVPEWFDELCHQGMPHHVVVFSGHHTALLKRFSRLIGVGWSD